MAANLNKISQITKQKGAFSSTFVNIEAPFYDFETILTFPLPLGKTLTSPCCSLLFRNPCFTERLSSLYVIFRLLY